MPSFAALFPLKMDAMLPASSSTCYNLLAIKVCTLNCGGQNKHVLVRVFFHNNRKGTKPGGDGTKLTIIACNSLEMVRWGEGGVGSNGNKVGECKLVHI